MKNVPNKDIWEPFYGCWPEAIPSGFLGGEQNGRYIITAKVSPFNPIVACSKCDGVLVVFGFDLAAGVLAGVHTVSFQYRKNFNVMPWAFGRFPECSIAGRYSNDDTLDGLFEEYNAVNDVPALRAKALSDYEDFVRSQ